MKNIDSIELPDTITVKFETKKTESEFLNILKCLYIEDKQDLPFRLPRLVSWPRGKKAVSDRAAILLKNGFFDLIEKQVKTTYSNKSAEKEDSLIKEKEELVDDDGFSPHLKFSNVNDKLVM